MKTESKDFTEMIELLRTLDKKSLSLIDSGARLLKARQDLESADKPKTA